MRVSLSYMTSTHQRKAVNIADTCTRSNWSLCWEWKWNI